jgi:hypothetical protein
LWTNDIGVYTVPGGSKKFLWRFSVNKPDWRADDVQGVDISTLLFGLAAHPSVLGPEFFETFNNFDFPDLSGIKTNQHRADPDYGLFHSVYPNPFNAKTIIRYELDAPSNVTLSIYDVHGRRVAEHVFSEQHRGMHLFSFDASNLSSGLYVARLQTDRATDHRKILLTK